MYATISNGPSYSSREKDRFKDYAVRVSLTPLAAGKAKPIFRTLTLTAWRYKGATPSAYVNGGSGQVGAIGEALDRSRAGVFVGIKDPRLVLGAEYAQRHENGEQGSNTAAKPRTRTDITGTMRSFIAVVRPFAFSSASGKSPFGIVARHDLVTPSRRTSGYVTPAAPSTANAYHTAIGGIFYDLNQKAQFALDYQESLASSNGLSSAPPAPSKGYYLHFQVNF